MKTIQKLKKQKRVRKKIKGTKSSPRLSVFRSNKYIYAQLIDDENGKTLFGITQEKGKTNTTRIEQARNVGVALAKKAIEQKIKQVVFDKGPYAYHGRVKALAEGAREGGLTF